jgi:hypothetical protein
VPPSIQRPFLKMWASLACCGPSLMAENLGGPEQEAAFSASARIGTMLETGPNEGIPVGQSNESALSRFGTQSAQAQPPFRGPFGYGSGSGQHSATYIVVGDHFRLFNCPPLHPSPGLQPHNGLISHPRLGTSCHAMQWQTCGPLRGGMPAAGRLSGQCP